MLHGELTALALSVAMAVAAALVGCFAVMRRMSLAADAVSHIALPGIGLALLIGAQPLAGALAMLVVGVLVIWLVQHRTQLPAETVIGVVFTTSLAAGSLMMTGEELIDALLGEPGRLNPWELGFAFVASIGVIAFVLLQKSRLLVALVSPEIAHASGIRVARLDLQYLFALAITVALGLRYLGVLLMGSLIIIPAAAAKRAARNLRGMLSIAVAISVLSTVVGTTVGLWRHLRPGPPIVIVAALCFLVTLLRPARA